MREKRLLKRENPGLKFGKVKGGSNRRGTKKRSDPMIAGRRQKVAHTTL